MSNILRKRLDWPKGLFPPRSLPVCVQLVLVKARPLAHERKRTVGERPGEQLTVQIDRGDLARVPGMEVRASVHALVPVHPDRDPLKEADPRHAENGTDRS
jgi:hypothetical protein